MEPRHITASSSNHAYDFHRSRARRGSDARGTADRFSGPLAMAIQVPNRRAPEAPPPLPPPRYVNDLAPDHGSGRMLGLASGEGQLEESRAPPAAGLSFPKSWGARMDPAQPEGSSDYRRRKNSTTSAISTLGSPTDFERRSGFSRFHDEGYYSLSGPSAKYQQSVLILYFFKIRSPSPVRGANSITHD